MRSLTLRILWLIVRQTSYYYLQSRYYDPEWGRFINADEFELLSIQKQLVGQSNIFEYSFNNPVNYSDDSGHWPKLKTTRINKNTLKIHLTIKASDIADFFKYDAWLDSIIGAICGFIPGGYVVSSVTALTVPIKQGISYLIRKYGKKKSIYVWVQFSYKFKKSKQRIIAGLFPVTVTRTYVHLYNIKSGGGLK